MEISEFGIRNSGFPCLHQGCKQRQCQQIRAEAGEYETAEQQQVAGEDETKRTLQGDAQRPVPQGEGVKGQIDADGMEHAVPDKGIVHQSALSGPIHKTCLGPPQIPCQSRIVDAVTGHVGHDVGQQRPGQDQRQTGEQQQDEEIASRGRHDGYGERTASNRNIPPAIPPRACPDFCG